MILIISEDSDLSTNDVISWLDYFNSDWERINDKDTVDVIIRDDSNTRLYLKDKEIDFDKIDSYWYRRGNFNYNHPFKYQIFFKKLPFFNRVLNSINEEIEVTREILHFQLLSKKGINNRLRSSQNKIVTLLVAKQYGLTIPKTLLTNRLSEAKEFVKNNKTITKAISEAIFFQINNEGGLQAYTNLVEKVTNFSKIPALFQNQIHKKYELRIFYLHGKMYSMAIFSQNDKRTSLDFRKYNNEKPNRTVPFNLPSVVENKIIQFMNHIQLNSGSIDMIVNKDNEYIFLEVNPIGQFGMVSLPCNYYLEKKIAKYLN